MATTTRLLSHFTPTWALPLLQPLLSQPRDLDAVEAFSGAGHLAAALARAGLRVETFDKVDDCRQNVLTFSGMLYLFALVARIREGGLLWLGPPCSMWVWMSASVHRRNADNSFYGDMSNASVREGNSIAVIVATTIRVAFARHVQIFYEQPKSSVQPCLPPMKVALGLCRMKKVITWLGAFSESLPIGKPLQIWSNCRCLPRLQRQQPQNKPEDHGMYTVSLDGRVTGHSSLSLSAAYPPEFGAAVGGPMLNAMCMSSVCQAGTCRRCLLKGT